ncbi:MAG: aspartate kinase [Peptostreptococcaceae bacterium]
MSTIVQKYGGTSVGSIEKIRSVAQKVIYEKEKGNKVVVVVSAMGKTTDNLVSLSKNISENPSKRELDMLLSTGEQISITLLSMAIQSLGYDAVSLTGFQAGIKTSGVHTKNKIDDIDIDKIKNYLNKGKIVVVAGFQGMNEDGDITTLGRGGSDTTAVAIAAKLECQCEIYTDVEGIYSVDPRVYKDAKKLEIISYEEMIEMASLGAGIMETRAVEIGFKYNVPIYVASSSKDIKGTYIKEYEKCMEEKVVKGIAINNNISMITVKNILFKTGSIAIIMEKLAKENINIDMISQTSPDNGYVNLSFTANKEDLNSIINIIDNIKVDMKDIEVGLENNISKVSVVGLGMMNQSDMIGKMFRTLADNNIEFKQFTTSGISVSYTVESKDKDRAVEAFAKEFNL